jgi:guanylate kinase
MILKDKIILIVGKSGTGKSTLVDTVCAKLGFYNTKSYTTREPRKNDCSHHFITKEKYQEYKANGLIYGEDYLFGHNYFVLKHDMDVNHFYITSPKTANELTKKLNKLNCLTKTIHFYASDDIRIQRLKERGDSETEILYRLSEEAKIFKDVKYDIELNTSYDFEDNYNRLKLFTLLFYRNKF